MTARILVGHVLDRLAELPDESVHCIVTSPPYWGLRDYKIEPQVWGGDPGCAHTFDTEVVTAELRTGLGMAALGEQYRGGGHKAGKVENIRAERGFCSNCGAWRGSLGLEPDFRLYIEHLVAVFDQVWRVLRPDGTVWLNLGDCYATGAGTVGNRPGGGKQGDDWCGYPGGRGHRGRHQTHQSGKAAPRIEAMGPMTQPNRMPQPGLKPKDLVMLPHRCAIALQERGWWVRQDNVWHKLNPMPESVTDRTTRAHEYLFLLTKAARYYYVAEAIAEPIQTDPAENYPARATVTGRGQQGFAFARGNDRDKSGGFPPRRAAHSRGTKRSPPIESAGIGHEGWCASMTRDDEIVVRNKRSVWPIATQPFPEAHFATFPPALVEPCILAGCPVGGTVLDPFGGAGTTGLVADRLGRNAILIELNPAYADIAKRRLKTDANLFADVQSD